MVSDAHRGARNMGVKAAILIRAGEPLAIEEIELLPLGPCDVRVRITATSLCHTDVSARSGAIDYDTPVIMGHEAAGVVEEIGHAVLALKRGDLVVSASAPACNRCPNCIEGRPHLCQLSQSVRSVPRARRADGSLATGLYGLGTFAEEMVVDQASLVAVDTVLPAAQLSLIGCGVTTGLSSALNRANICVGGSIAVIGCGTVGLAAIVGASIAGAATIIAIDPRAERRADALHHGATLCLDPVNDSVEDAVLLACKAGVDSVIDAVGSPATLAQARAIARRAGEIVIVGMPGRDTVYTIAAFPFFLSEQRLSSALFGSAVIRRDIPAFIRLAEAGKIDLSRFISRKIALDDVNAGLDALASGEVLRTVISWD